MTDEAQIKLIIWLSAITVVLWPIVMITFWTIKDRRERDRRCHRPDSSKSDSPPTKRSTDRRSRF